MDEELNVERNEEEDVRDNQSKKKKKKKKHKKIQKENYLNTSSYNEDESLDEIDKTVKQINKLLGEPVPSTSLVSADNLQAHFVVKSKEKTLAVHHKNLNPFNELRRIFGSKTIQAEQQ